MKHFILTAHKDIVEDALNTIKSIVYLYRDNITFHIIHPFENEWGGTLDNAIATNQVQLYDKQNANKDGIITQLKKDLSYFNNIEVKSYAYQPNFIPSRLSEEQLKNDLLFLYIPELQITDRALYLSNDSLLTGNIDRLWEFNFQTTDVAMVLDIETHVEKLYEQAEKDNFNPDLYPKQELTYDTNVMLFNMNIIRQQNWSADFQKANSRNRITTKHEFINLIFKNKTLILKEYYNLNVNSIVRMAKKINGTPSLSIIQNCISTMPNLPNIISCPNKEKAIQSFYNLYYVMDFAEIAEKDVAFTQNLVTNTLVTHKWGFLIINAIDNYIYIQMLYKMAQNIKNGVTPLLNELDYNKKYQVKEIVYTLEYEFLANHLLTTYATNANIGITQTPVNAYIFYKKLINSNVVLDLSGRQL